MITQWHSAGNIENSADHFAAQASSWYSKSLYEKFCGVTDLAVPSNQEAENELILCSSKVTEDQWGKALLCGFL